MWMAQVSFDRRRACEEAVFHPTTFSGIHITIAENWNKIHLKPLRNEIYISPSACLPAPAAQGRRNSLGRRCSGSQLWPLWTDRLFLVLHGTGALHPSWTERNKPCVSCHPSTLPAPHCKSSALDPWSSPRHGSVSRTCCAGQFLGKDKEIQSSNYGKKDWCQCRCKGSQDHFLLSVCWLQVGFFLHLCFKPVINEEHFDLLKVKKMYFRHLENEQVFNYWKNGH